MTREECRWAQIVFYTEGDLLEIHRRERILYKKCEALIASRKSPIEWWDLGYMSRMEDTLRLVPYWPAPMPESDRKVRMYAFLRIIYPVWRGITKRMDSEIEGSAAADCPEIMHKCDLTIWKMGKRPGRKIASENVEYETRREENARSGY